MDIIDLTKGKTPELYNGITKRTHNYLRHRLGTDWHYGTKQFVHNAEYDGYDTSQSVPVPNSPFWKHDIIRDPRNCISNYCIKTADIPSNYINANQPLQKSLYSDTIRIEEAKKKLSSHNRSVHKSRKYFLDLQSASSQCMRAIDPNDYNITQVELCEDEIQLTSININKSYTNLICPNCNIYFQSIPVGINEIYLICFNYPYCKYPINQSDFHTRFKWTNVKYVGPVKYTANLHFDTQFIRNNNIKQEKLYKRMKKKELSFNAVVSTKRMRNNTIDNNSDSEPKCKKRKLNKNAEIACICGDFLAETTCVECYGEERVECNECDIEICDKLQVIYHCNKENFNMKNHKNGFDLCQKCALKRKHNHNINNNSGSDVEILYCICRKPDNGLENMICCDFCDEWYHITCIGLDYNKFVSVQESDYKCFKCIGVDNGKKKKKKKRKRRKKKKFDLINADIKILKHEFDEKCNLYKFKIKKSKNDNVTQWFYGDEIDISKIIVFKKYLETNKLLSVAEIIGNKESFLGDMLFEIKWKGFKQGFDEWKSNDDLIGNNIYSAYCKKNNIIGCEIIKDDVDINDDKQICGLKSHFVEDSDEESVRIIE